MGKRILVVDDEVVVLGAVGKALKNTDCIVDTVENAEEALKLCGAAHYDVVITDLMMPGVDGLELMQRLRTIPCAAQVIMITGYPTIRTALKAKRLGAFEYVTKPFTRQELVSAVVRALRRGAAQVGEPERSSSPKASDGAYFIPEHSWARMESDGTVRIGIAGAFASTVGRIKALTFPGEDDLMEQGRICAIVHAEDGVEHYLCSPLSGRVTELNQNVLNDPELAGRDPEGAGWLFHLAPHNAEKELPNLTPH